MSEGLTRLAREAVCYLLEELTRVVALNVSGTGFLDVIDGGTITDAQALDRLARVVRSSTGRLSEEAQAVRRLALLVRAVDGANVRRHQSHTILLGIDEEHRMVAGSFSLITTVENLGRTLTETFMINQSQITRPADLFAHTNDAMLAEELWDAIVGAPGR